MFGRACDGELGWVGMEEEESGSTRRCWSHSRRSEHPSGHLRTLLLRNRKLGNSSEFVLKFPTIDLRKIPIFLPF